MEIVLQETVCTSDTSPLQLIDSSKSICVYGATRDLKLKLYLFITKYFVMKILIVVSECVFYITGKNFVTFQWC